MYRAQPGLWRLSLIHISFGVTPPDAVFSSAPEELETALAYLAEHYGTAESYLLQAGAAARDIAAVRGMLLGEACA